MLQNGDWDFLTHPTLGPVIRCCFCSAQAWNIATHGLCQASPGSGLGVSMFLSIQKVAMERALPLSASFVVSKLHYNHEVDTIIRHLTARKVEVQRSAVTAHGDKEMVRSPFNDKATCLRTLSCCCFYRPSLRRGASFCLLFSAFLQSTKSGQVRAQWPERG